MSQSKHLNYSSIKPLGVPSKVKIAKFLPQNAYGNITATDTIRFQINTPGFWDPYSAYFNIEVDCEGMADEVFQQLDSSAHSLISELIIYSKGTEIERIQEYDALAAILGDLTFSPEQRASRMHEGYGYRHKTKPNYTEASRSIVPLAASGAITGLQVFNSGPHPFRNKNNSHASHESATNQLLNTAEITTDIAFAYTDSNIEDKIQAAKNLTGAGFSDIDRNFYGLDRADSLLERYDTNAIVDSNTVSNGKGFTKTYDPALSNSCGEQKFSQNVLYQITGGQIGQPKKVLKAQFSIPILSGLVGVLMPRESYKYLPMSALEDLIIEIRLNKYALFTSGYSNETWGTDDSFADAMPFGKSVSTMAKRTFKISKFELMADIVMFDPVINDAVLNQLDSEDGIVLHSNSWYLGPQFLTANTQNVTGTWQINLGFESLKSLVFYFLSEDYKVYDFCRKHYRLSRNVTWMQAKIGIDYYPSFPIEGNGGSTANTEGNGDNSEFLINTYKAFNKLHDAMSDNFINKVNFAVNERPYDVTKTGPFFDNATNDLDNIHTACGLPGYFENQCVGKAVYGLNLEGLREDDSVMSGINTIVNKPFEITLRTDPSTVDSTKDRAATMYVMCLYDFLVQIKRTGIKVLGRG